MQNNTLILSTLLLNLFIAFLGIGLVIPVTPTIMNELNISGATVGYMVSAFAFAQLILSPLAGRAVDKYGRKPMIIIGLFIFSMSELLFGLGQSVEVLFASRILGGVSAAFIMPAVTAFIADITTNETRPKALGYMSAAISTGFIIGPGIGGFLADLGSRTPFFFAAAFGLTAMVLSVFTLKEPERHYETTTVKQQTGFRKVFSPLYFIAFLVLLISSFGLASFESLFALFVDRKFGFTAKDIALAISLGAIVGVIVQVGLFDRLTRWFGEIRLIRYSLIGSTLLVVLMTFVTNYLSIILVTMVVFVGFDLMRPAVTTYLSKIAGNEQGFVGGMNSMFTSIGNILGPIVGGLLFDVNLNYPFYFATAMLAVGIFLTYFWRAPRAEATKADRLSS
ncbi:MULTISPECIES: MFS transporter [Exiguobacterium]|uniref:MFS transporter n=1 Tax=Exiguobacterium TaxID=33986 RepID=UPI0004944164|nr:MULTISPECIES: MFS transporter [Exiguobacterium]HBQ76725.1 MFS transporter [Exiguobacterium sp.]HCD59907.1 MFS transporter [Exiguobacterium sp.]